MSKVLICSEKNLKKNLEGNVYVVTGTTSGIGLATVKQLAKQSATIVCASRNIELSNKLIDDISNKYSNKNLHFIHLDLTSLKSVRKFVKTFNSRFKKLDGLVNNAGVMHTPRQTTDEGFELQFGVNFLGHFLLTELLLPTLEKTKDSRIIHTSSVMHDRASIDLEDLNFEKRKYSRIEAYNQSKLAQVIYARYQTKLSKKLNITSVSIHPGWVQTPLIKYTLPVFFQNVLLKPFLVMAGMINVKLGCQTTLHCLLNDGILNNPGCFYSQTGIYKDKKSRPGGWPMKSPNDLVYDDILADNLYKKSKSLVGLKT